MKIKDLRETIAPLSEIDKIAYGVLMCGAYCNFLLKRYGKGGYEIAPYFINTLRGLEDDDEIQAMTVFPSTKTMDGKLELEPGVYNPIVAAVDAWDEDCSLLEDGENLNKVALDELASLVLSLCSTNDNVKQKPSLAKDTAKIVKSHFDVYDGNGGAEYSVKPGAFDSLFKDKVLKNTLKLVYPDFFNQKYYESKKQMRSLVTMLSEALNK